MSASCKNGNAICDSRQGKCTPDCSKGQFLLAAGVEHVCHKQPHLQPTCLLKTPRLQQARCNTNRSTATECKTKLTFFSLYIRTQYNLRTGLGGCAVIMLSAMLAHPFQQSTCKLEAQHRTFRETIESI